LAEALAETDPFADDPFGEDSFGSRPVTEPPAIRERL